MNRKQRMKNRMTAIAVTVQPTVICSNCGLLGPHFAPPSFGEAGFFTCVSMVDLEPEYSKLIDDNFWDLVGE